MGRLLHGFSFSKIRLTDIVLSTGFHPEIYRLFDVFERKRKDGLYYDKMQFMSNMSSSGILRINYFNMRFFN